MAKPLINFRIDDSELITAKKQNLNKSQSSHSDSNSFDEYDEIDDPLGYL